MASDQRTLWIDSLAHTLLRAQGPSYSYYLFGTLIWYSNRWRKVFYFRYYITRMYEPIISRYHGLPHSITSDLIFVVVDTKLVMTKLVEGFIATTLYSIH